MTEREFFEYLNWVLFFVFEILAGIYGGWLWSQEENNT